MKILPVDLYKLDNLRPNAVALFCFSDVRPLGGVAGYLDWRLCGEISKQIEEGRFVGNWGEKLLLISNGRLGRVRIYVFGLGDQKSYQKDICEKVGQEAVKVLKQAGEESIIFAEPIAPESGKSERTFSEVMKKKLSNQIHYLWTDARSILVPG